MKNLSLYSFMAWLPALALLSLSSCLKDGETSYLQTYSPEEYRALQRVLNLPDEQVNYKITLPQHMTNSGVSTPIIHNAKATLGRVLFYDKQLSRNETVSCESCHKQALAFSDNKAFSQGFNGEFTRRNSLPLAAAANFVSSYGSSFSSLSIGFFWDERAHSIADQSLQTIQDDIEMGMDINDLAARLKGQEHYEILFRKAYGDANINSDRITQALQEFLNAFSSNQSRFDEGLGRALSPNMTFSNFTPQENRGKELFLNHCSSCHGADMTRQFAALANNGLDLDYTDNGVGVRTGEPSLNGVFKVPFLRNIALTAPYMHDGRFETLEEVVEHYNSGVNNHPNLDFRLKDGNQPHRLNLSETDKQALVAFLNTLTDEAFVSDTRFSNPFR